MSTPPRQPESGPQSADDQQDDGARPDQQRPAASSDDYVDQDSEPSLTAPDAPDGTISESGDAGGQDGQGEDTPLPPGEHGSARRPPADS